MGSVERLQCPAPVANDAQRQKKRIAEGGFRYFPLSSFNIASPIFRSNPCLEVGIPVSRAICCLIFVMPNTRFHENVTPGILSFVISLFIYKSHSLAILQDAFPSCKHLINLFLRTFPTRFRFRDKTFQIPLRLTDLNGKRFVHQEVPSF